MQPSRFLVVALLLGVVPACASHRSARSACFHQPLTTGLTGSDVVQMDVALVETPIGDRFVNEGLWTLTDEQMIPLEQKAVLESNGFRIGHIGATPPAELQALLTSERSCANPRRIQVHAEHSAPPLVLGPTLAQAHYQLLQGETQTPVVLEQAQCNLVVTPTVLAEGRTRLRFVPQVKYGQTQLQTWKPNSERSGWSMQMEQPTENYPHLAWEVTVAPNDYLVIGVRYDRPETLGYQAFVRREEAPPVQRLLVIRCSRLQTLDSWSELATSEQTGEPHTPPPLVVQARYSSVRGTQP